MNKVKFNNSLCDVEFHHYPHNNQTAILLTENGLPVAKATICVDVEIGPDEVVIKDYSENEGMLEALVNAGIVTQTNKIVQSGFVNAPVAKLIGACHDKHIN